mmetsp:Transcript_16486/g.24972  ORF Transcript_16486/g.24972 Transcript_16486/m.24972 type:complete len:108 (-) Transcript_16486:43-366(-)
MEHGATCAQKISKICSCERKSRASAGNWDSIARLGGVFHRAEVATYIQGRKGNATQQMLLCSAHRLQCNSGDETASHAAMRAVRACQERGFANLALAAQCPRKPRNC